MFSTVEKANQALKLVAIILGLFILNIYHRYQMEKYPFDGRLVRNELVKTKMQLDASDAYLKAEHELNVQLQEDLNELKVAKMLSDTIQSVVNSNAVMAKELELVRAHKEELVGVYSDDDERYRNITDQLIDVQKEYAKNSGLPGAGSKDEKDINKFFFDFQLPESSDYDPDDIGVGYSPLLPEQN